MTTENRGHVRGEVRAVADDGTIEVLAVAHGITDDYGTQFQRGTFTESLEERLPVIAWAHSWDEPIGKPMAAKAIPEGLAVDGEIYPKMYEGASVAEGMRRKVYQEASIGYYVDEWEQLSYEACVKYWASKGYAPSIQDHQRAAGGVVLLKKIRLEEVAICIRGANSQARVTGVKSAFRKLFGRMFSAPEKSAAEAVKKAPEIDQKAVDELVESLVSACRAAIVAEITKQAAITANEVNPKVSQDETGAPDDAADEDADLVAVMAQLDELDTEDDDF